jgi:hypothetical protein
LAASSRTIISAGCFLVFAAAFVVEALRGEHVDSGRGALVRDAGTMDAPGDADAGAKAVAQFDEGPIELGPLEDACRRTLCPGAWSDVLAQASWFAQDRDWRAFLGCGQVNVVSHHTPDTGHSWFFDLATGRLVGFSEYAYFWAAHGQRRFGETPSLEGCLASSFPQPPSGAIAAHPDEFIAGDVTASDWWTALASMQLLCSDPMRFDRVSVFRACNGADVIAASVAYHEPDATIETHYWEYAASTGALVGMGLEYRKPNETAPPGLRPSRYGPIPDLSGCSPTVACSKAPR